MIENSLKDVYLNTVFQAVRTKIETKKFLTLANFQTTWNTPFENTFLSSRYSTTPMQDLSAALWLYSGCRNLPLMYKVGEERRLVPNPRYGYINTQDYIETLTEINNALEEGDSFSIFAKAGEGDCSWEMPGSKYPSFVLTYSRLWGDVWGSAQIIGGDLGIICRRLLPAFAMINRRILTGSGETCFAVNLLGSRVSHEDAKHVMKIQHDELYSPAEPEWLSLLDTKELFSVIDDPMQMGGTQTMRRVLKPIILAGLAEADGGERLHEYIDQLPDGKMTDQLRIFYAKAT